MIYRDLSGEVDLLHRHCAHRGGSLEFGIVVEHGIRCVNRRGGGGERFAVWHPARSATAAVARGRRGTAYIGRRASHGFIAPWSNRRQRHRRLSWSRCDDVPGWRTNSSSVVCGRVARRGVRAANASGGAAPGFRLLQTAPNHPRQASALAAQSPVISLGILDRVGLRGRLAGGFYRPPLALFERAVACVGSGPSG